MIATLLEKLGKFLVPSLFILLMFVIPIDLYLKNILFGCCLLVLIIIPSYRKLILTQYFTLWGLTSAAFFGYILLACIWSDSPISHQWDVVRLYSKVILLPILALGFIHPQVRTWALNSYLAIILITCFLSILKSKGILEIGPLGDTGGIFYDHIMTGYMVAFASYIAGLLAIKYKGWLRLVYFCVLIISSYQLLFLNTGRTGYAIFIVLMILLLLLNLNFKQALLGIVLFCGAYALCYYESPTMQARVYDMTNDIKLYKQNQKDTSIGFRVQFHQYSESIFVKHPIFGIGTGGFMYQFYLDNPIPIFYGYLTDPNSQYWIILVEQGLVGIALLILFLGSLFLSALQLKENRDILLGLVISFSIGCISDTIICYSIVGYLFVTISALCLGELVEKRIPVKR